MVLLQKIRREILVGLSQLGLKSATLHRNGKKYSIPLIHGMGRWLFLRRDLWRRQVFSTFTESQAFSVFDIGANVGQSLLDIHENIPNAKYIGFEPNPGCVFYLNNLINRNDELKEFTVIPFGLNDKNESLTLLTKTWDDASGSLVSRKQINHRINIYTIVGDEFVSQEGIDNLALIKIDVEGFEYEVLNGLKETIKSQHPLIFCEMNPNQRRFEEINTLLNELDYVILGQAENQGTVQVERLPFAENKGNDFVLIHTSKALAFEKSMN